MLTNARFANLAFLGFIASLWLHIWTNYIVNQTNQCPVRN